MINLYKMNERRNLMSYDNKKNGKVFNNDMK